MIDASIIIPTYNRSQNLRRVLESICKLDYPRENFEVVIIDNNCTDDTPVVAKQYKQRGLNIQYVKEPRLSFTCAREAGAKVAVGAIQNYIDDDIEVDKGWLSAIMEIFHTDPKAGIVAGHIEPAFEASPEPWVLSAQEMFNGLSLCNYSKEISDAPGACGPSFSVRASVLKEVGGWPPDSIGVDSFKKAGSVERIHVGPGDWGLNLKVKKAGYAIKFVPRALVHHYIPPERLTWRWWVGRHKGEGYMLAFTYQVWENQDSRTLRRLALRNFLKAGKLYLRYLQKILKGDMKKYGYRLLVYQYLTRGRVQFALAREPGLGKKFWDAALTGVQDKELSRLSAMLPKA